MASRSSVAIIIIGDEILKGQTMDTNSHFLCQELYESGVEVARVSVVPDDIKIIAEEIRTCSEKYSFVFTSGGIGPTHDDITYEGIAKAFDEKTILNEDLKNILSDLCANMVFDEMAVQKMAQIPKSSKIHPIYTSKKEMSFPVVSVKNVYAFSGIPSYLRFAFTQLKSLFCDNSVEYFSRTLYINRNEFVIMDALNMVVQEYDGSVKFGSYPDVENEYYQVKITIEGDSEDLVLAAEAFLRSHLPCNSVVGKFPPCSKSALLLLQDTFIEGRKLYDYDIADAVKMSLKILDECDKKYSLWNTCISFNGGKDCTVLLHLTCLYLKKHYPKKSEKLNAFYVRSKQPFSETEDFIDLCVKRYNLKLITYDLPIKDALTHFKQDHPSNQAILMGSRSTDPLCSDLKTFQMTDSDWPQFMRVNPLITWTYDQVWKFLRVLDVPYCSLYDRGYTSVGCQPNTLPNEQLLTTTKSGRDYYLPAYLLKDSKQERKGRVANKV